MDLARGGEYVNANECIGDFGAARKHLTPDEFQALVDIEREIIELDRRRAVLAADRRKLKSRLAGRERRGLVPSGTGNRKVLLSA